MASMDGVTVPNNVPRTKGGEESCVEIPKENLPSSKEKMSQAEMLKEDHPSSKERLPRAEASNDRPSKKKKYNHKDGSKNTPRIEEPSSSKRRETKNVSKALHLRI